MAVKSKAQYLTLIQEIVRMHDYVLSFATGTFETQYNTVSSAIAAGDDQPEDSEQMLRLRALRDQLGATYQAALDLVNSLHLSLGRYAGNANLNDPDSNLWAFAKKLVDDAEAVEQRGWTKNAPSADGGNVGDPTFAYLYTDLLGDTIEGGRAETYTLKCVEDAVDGAQQPGAELWEISGTVRPSFPWRAAGIGASEDAIGYTRQHGRGKYDYEADVESQIVGDQFNGIGASGSANNLLANGDFESVWGTGTTKIPRWTFSAGDTTVYEDTSAPLFGDRSPRAEADFLLRQLLAVGMTTKRAYCFEAYIYATSGAADLAGSFIMRIKDTGGNTHASKTVDLSAIAEATLLKTGFTAFILTTSIEGDLYFEIEVDNLAGTTPKVWWDNVKLGEMVLVDEGFFAQVLQGATDSRQDDFATIAFTSTDAGLIQRALNLGFNGGYVKAAAAAVYWTDPA